MFPWSQLSSSQPVADRDAYRQLVRPKPSMMGFLATYGRTWRLVTLLPRSVDLPPFLPQKAIRRHYCESVA